VLINVNAPIRIQGDAQLDDLPFIVVDVETTGCSIWGGDRITEVATVEVQGGAVGRTWSTLVYPQRPIPLWITTLTGISDDMVREAPPFWEVAEQVRLQLGAGVFVGHNVGFDWRFLNAELERTTGDGFALDARRLCTVRLTRVFLRRLERRSLDHLASYYGISIFARHRALGDAVATAHCLTHLLEAARRAGIGTLDELDAYLAARRPGRRKRRRRSFMPSFCDPTHIA
ncbi:MAG: 3'-5' exonuclease, partial [Gemmatimonadaceae bacterium]